MVDMETYDQDVTGEKKIITFDAEEGNFTASTVLTRRGYADGGSFAAELLPGTEVEIVTTVDKCVQKAASGIYIGKVVTFPDGAIPSTTKASGAYVRRVVGVELAYGHIVRRKLISTNQAVSPGDYIALANAAKTQFDKEEDTTSNLIALEAAGASSGKYIDCWQIGKAQTQAD